MAEAPHVEPSAAEPRVATSDELRRAALERSAARNAQVSRQRLRRRWLTWVLYKLLLWTLPVLILAELAWALWLREHPLPAKLQAIANGFTRAASPQAQSPSAVMRGSGTSPGDL
jgi:hypothetical protein